MDGILEDLCTIVNNPYDENSKSVLSALNRKLEMYNMDTLNYPTDKEAFKKYYTFCQGAIKNILRNASIYKLSKKEAIKKIIDENNKIISYEDMLEKGEVSFEREEKDNEELGLREKYRLLQEQDEIVKNLNDND